jgi:transketolase
VRAAFVGALTRLAAEDPRVMLLTGDLGYGVFEDFQARFGERYLNVGIAEQNLMGVATGLALEGRTVFVYSIGNFPTFRCLEQLRSDACYHGANVNVVANGGGFSYGALGMSHHATEDLAVLRALPGTTVVAPASDWEAAEATRALAARPGVGYLRLDKAGVPDTPGPDEVFSIGRARRLREGGDVTLIATGSIAAEALAAAERLALEGIAARVVSMHTVKPLDLDEVAAAAATGAVVTVEEHTVNGGLGGAVAEACMEMDLRPRGFARIGLRDTFSAVVGSQAYLRRHYGMDGTAIADAARALLGSQAVGEPA